MSLHVGDVAPEELVVDLDSEGEGVNLTSVTASKLWARKPDGTLVEWAVVETNKTTTTLTLTHGFSAAPSELDISGEWRIWAELTVPAGTIFSDRAVLPIKARHGL